MPLRRSKSLFGTDKLPLSEGYLDPISLRKQHLVNDENDDEEDFDEEAAEAEDGRHLSSVGLLGGDNPEGEADTAPCKGGPFSALTPSMWPAKGMYVLTYLCDLGYMMYE